MKKWIKIAGLLMLSFPVALQAGDYTYITNSDNTITITGYTGSGGDVTIPDTINSLPVTTIGDQAFSRCTSLASITIPDSVTTIEVGAFLECQSLTNIIIPGSVTEIGSYAFLLCENLTEVYFRGNAPYTGDLPFFMSNVTVYRLFGASGWPVVPDLWADRPTALYNVPGWYGLTVLNGSGSGCSYTNGEQVAISADAPASGSGKTFDQWAGDTQYVDNVTHMNALVTMSTNAISLTATYKTLLGCHTLTVSNGTGSGAYTNGTQVTITATAPEGTAFNQWTGDTQYVDNVFSWTTTVTMPAQDISLTATYVGIDFAYRTQPGNTITIAAYIGSGGDVTIPNTINGLPVTSIGGRAFFNRTNLTSVIIPNSITEIGSYAFYNCTNLNNVMLGTNATSIGYETFGGCINLSSFTIPNSVTTIGGHAFVRCTSLASITIPDSVTTIGSGAFAVCTSLTNIAIPNSVTSIGASPFSNCDGLTSITVNETNSFYCSVDGVLFDKSQTTLIQYPGGKAGSYYSIPNSVTTIGDKAFFRCTSLASITIPDSVTSIAYGAFAYCTGLTSVTIPSIVTNIGGHAFSRCINLTNVIIPNGVTSIEDSTFSACTSLTCITIPNSITSIAQGAFRDCTGLTNITIPGSVTRIGDSAFLNCTSMMSIYFQGNAPSLDLITVFSGAANATIYYLPSTTGWTNTFGGRPTALWRPQLQTGDSGFGMQTNGFGFNINWADGMTVVVEACTNLAEGVWGPVKTNTLTGGSVQFRDPDFTNYPNRYYRVSMPQ